MASGWRLVVRSASVGNGGSVGRIEPTVYAVGWDGRNSVAKRQPDGDRGIASYYIIDSNKDAPHREPRDAVIGPVEGKDFERRAKQLDLSAFSKTLTFIGMIPMPKLHSSGPHMNELPRVRIWKDSLARRASALALWITWACNTQPYCAFIRKHQARW